MRVRLYQDGPITAEQFFEVCGRKTELDGGWITGPREVWEFDEPCEHRLVRALRPLVDEVGLELRQEVSRGGADSRVRQPSALEVGSRNGARIVCENASRGDLAEELNAKVMEHLSGGALVWVLYPRTREVHVFAADGSVRVLRGGDALDGGDVLPGFRLPLAKLWG
jgi:hypothetical protein